jgi:hypothetical protein
LDTAGSGYSARKSDSVIPENYGKSLKDSVKQELRDDLERSRREFTPGRVQRFPSTPVTTSRPVSPLATSSAVAPLAMVEEREEYKNSQLSIIARGQGYDVEFRRGRNSSVGTVESRPLRGYISEETVRGLEDVYVGQILKSMRQPPNERDARGRFLEKFYGLLVSFGSILSNALGDEVAAGLAGLPEGSRLLLRLDENALGIPWELANRGNLDSVLGINYSIGKIVVSDQEALKNNRVTRRNTRVLMIAAASEEAAWGDRALRGFLPILANLERSLSAVGVTVDKIMGRDVTRENIVRKLQGDNDVVIFNTHGTFDDMRMQTCLGINQNEFLTSRDIYQIYRASQHPPPLLWVSYACETATQTSWGRSESSLAATFNLLGVPFIGPYWSAWGSKLETQMGSTDILLKTFFSKVFSKPPSTVGDALMAGKRAATEREEDAAYPDWANFTLYGSPGLAITVGK